MDLFDLNGRCAAGSFLSIRSCHHPQLTHHYTNPRAHLSLLHLPFIYMTTSLLFHLNSHHNASQQERRRRRRRKEYVMAPSFARSISFSLTTSTPARSRHVRSISLPTCRSHPLLAHLLLHNRHHIASASSGLDHVAALHGAIADLLLLPENQQDAAIANSDRLLDTFLVLADAHRRFQETLLALKADVADVQAAIRRRDAARLASAVRSQSRNEKALARLAATVSAAAAPANKKCAAEDQQTTAVALVDAVAASAASSAAVFSAVASMSASASASSSFSSNNKTFKAAFTTKDKDTNKKLIEDLAQCIDACEAGSEMVFRSIVRTRVALLNIRTPTI